MPAIQKEVIGKKFGDLLVLECIGKAKNNSYIYLCECTICKRQRKVRSDCLVENPKGKKNCHKHCLWSKKDYPDKFVKLYNEAKKFKKDICFVDFVDQYFKNWDSLKRIQDIQVGIDEDDCFYFYKGEGYDD